MNILDIVEAGDFTLETPAATLESPVYSNGKTSIILAVEYVAPDCEMLFRSYSEREWLMIIKAAKDEAEAANGGKYPSTNALIPEIERRLKYPDGVPFGAFFNVEDIKPVKTREGIIVDYERVRSLKPVHRKKIRYYLKLLDNVAATAKRNARTFAEQLEFVANVPLTLYQTLAR
ncbi:MAG: hypothetical protein MJ168_13025 [Clostridia bacterium]|nr:hypothetical protein [Clostridia bacterium]